MELLYYPQYCEAAVLSSVILLIIYYLRQNFNTVKNKLFLSMVVINLAAAIVDICSVYTITYTDRFSLRFNYFINELYLILYNVLAIIFLLYIVSFFKIRFYQNCVYYYAVCIFIFEAIIIFTTHITHFVFYFDSRLNYFQGPGMWLLYVCAFSCVIIANVIVIKVRKTFNKYPVLSVTGFIIGLLVSIIVQIFIPKYLITNFTLSMVLFFLYSSLENPVYYLFNTTQCFNQQAFVQTIRSNNEKRKFYKVVAIKPMDYSYFEYTMGQRNSEMLSNKIAERLNIFFKREAYALTKSEFAVIIPDDTNTNEFLTKVDECFSEKFVIQIDDKVIEQEVEVQVAIIPVINLEIDGLELEEVIHNLTFENGKRLLVLEDMEAVIEKIHRSNRITQVLERAIKEDGFQIYYQPIYDAEADTFHGAEALLRLIDNDLGFIGPDEFIPVAEKNGQIIEIGDMVLRKVCEFIKESGCLELGIEYIDVNLSPIQCRYEKLAEKYLSIIRSYGIDTKCVNLEITETAETEFLTVRVLKNIMESMVQHGVGFSIDDYGSGFATIDYLLEFPAEIVKIDKSILWQAMEREDAMIVLEYTIKLLKAIGKKIVVEGVENEEMKKILLDFGCDYLQGYLYSKPIPEADFIAFLEKENVRA